MTGKRIADGESAGLRGLSANEERYALAETMTDARLVEPWATRIDGPLDVDRLAAAVAMLELRHEALRRGFRPRPDGGWESFVGPGGRLRLERLAMPGADLAEIAARLTPELFAAVDLASPPLARFILIEIAADAHVLVHSCHHIVYDGRTEVLLRAELFALYAESAAAPPPAFVPADWRGGEALPRALDFWRERLGDLGTTATLATELAGDPQALNGTVIEPLGEADVARIATAAAGIGVSPFNWHFAAALVVLTRLVDRPRFPVAFQSEGRRGLAGAEGGFGVFSNALIVAPAVDPSASFASLARRLRGEVRDALVNEAAPYHEIIRATGVHATVGFNLFPRFEAVAVPGLRVGAPEPLPRRFDYDFNFRMLQGDGGWRLVTFYRADRFTDGFARAVSRRILALALEFAANPDAAIGAVFADEPVAAAGEPAPDVRAAPVFTAFLAHAAATPDAVACRFDGADTSYGALEAASRGLAQRLIAAGTVPGDRVVVLAERGPRLVAAMLGVARAGAVIVSCDTAYPQGRLAALTALATPKMLVWAGVDGKPDAAARTLAADTGLPLVDCDGEAPADSGSLPEVDPEATAYYLFTSGSTGTPKCVAASHRPLVNFVAWQAARFGLDAADRFTMLSGLSHDPLMRDIFTPLSIGATILIPRQAQIFEPRGLSTWCAAEQPTVMHLTPPLGRLLVAGAADGLRLKLRHAFWGGDLLRPEVAAGLRAIAPHVVNVNFYGATETPQAAAYFVGGDDTPWRAVPVGAGSGGFDVAVRDAGGRRKASGEIGEIVVASQFLSQGYVEEGALRPATSAAYRTGDLGFHLASGPVMLVGRADDQVKIRGYRVELAEVTAAVEASPLVAQAAVTAALDPAAPDADRRLVAHVVPAAAAPSGDAFTPALLADLSARVPAHIVPQQVRRLDRLPLLPNGKLDRAALVAGAAAEPAAPAAAAGEATATERLLMTRWSQLLRRPVTSPAESFASLSGDSLSFVQAYLVLEEVIGTVPENWQFLPIRQLAGSPAGAVRRGRIVDTSMLVRAVSILLVVGWHFALLDFNRGITSALIIASGTLFGSFQLADALRRRSPRPILTMLGRVFIPVALFTVALFALKAATGKDPALATLLMYTDLVDFSRLSPAEWPRYEVVLWYIHCLFHILLIVAAAVWLWSRLSPRRIDAFTFSTSLFAAGCATRFLLPAASVPDWLSGSAPIYNAFTYSPLTHLPTFMLGCMLAGADTPRRRYAVLAALVAYAAASWWLIPSLAWAFALAAGLVQLYWPHVRLPRLAAQLVFMLAGASLFIYLTHVQLLYALKRFGLGQGSVIGATLAVLAGVAAWRIWDWLWQRLQGRRAEPAADAAHEAI